MKKVAIVTDFYSIDPAYSLTRVAGNQIKMLLRAGYEPRVLVDENFTPAPYPWDSVELFKLPSVPRSNRAELPPDWESHKTKMVASLHEGLRGIDVAMSHDMIYQPAQILYNAAAREVTEERNGSLRWLHWVHSATPAALVNADTRYLGAVGSRFPHSFVVFPNEYSRPRVARNFGYEENEVKYVPHPIDVADFLGFTEPTRQLIDDLSLLGADVIMVYPCRLDRGKQVEFVIRIAAQLKKQGQSVRFICADFHSTGGDKVTYRDEMRVLSAQLGLSDVESVFTSQVSKELELRCPREMVRDLMLLSNVFVMPSRSETYSLVAQEAGMCGNVLLLNFDFPPMRSIYGESALYVKFGSNIDAMTGLDGNTDVQYHPNTDIFCADVAGRIRYELQTNRGVAMKTFLRKERNLDTVFKRYLEPLLHGR